MQDLMGGLGWRQAGAASRSPSAAGHRQRGAAVLIVVEQVGDREDTPHAPSIGDISAQLSEFKSRESAHRS